MKQKRGKEGNAVRYVTRNQALTRLQIKLPDFRRLCILKGIHPREPKKKTQGHHKTYYHIKDINFLAHEPLLETSRELKAHAKKVKKAAGRLEVQLAERLRKKTPTYTLDHLVKERYPTFVDALRDLDDAITMLHLFAVLPADKEASIPVEVVHTARRLSLEWQAYVTRTNALRKCFISVKGFYYQAEVWGQPITWLVPHALSQVIAPDVDFRVMLTFLEFYETLVEFVNFKLYHTLGLSYPPIVDERLEQVAAGLSAVVMEIQTAGSAAGPSGGQPALEPPESGAAAADGAEGEGKGADAPSAEVAAAGVAHRLASLQGRLAAMSRQLDEPGAPASEELPTVSPAEEEEAAMDEETRAARKLFQGLVFFLGREVPKEALLFILRAFGGRVGWQGEGSPLEESDESITHQVVDRPTQGHRFLSREYVQPQWVLDSVNTRFLIPTDAYVPGVALPPHLSPFVDNEEEGYLPEYAETLQKMRAAGQALQSMDADSAATEAAERASALLLSQEQREAAREAERARLEASHGRELALEISGVRFSAVAGGDLGEAAEPAAAQRGAAVSGAAAVPTEKEDEEAMARIMMPRKRQKLYEAMQMGLKKKKAHVETLEKKRQALAKTPVET